MQELGNSKKWAKLLRQKRKELGENQVDFGKRFEVSGAAVSYWESGHNDIPGEVTWWLTHEGKPHGR